MRIRSFIIAYALVLAILLFADRRPAPTSQGHYSHVIDLTGAPNDAIPNSGPQTDATQPSHVAESHTRIVAPDALIPGTWTAGQIPAERLIAPLVVMDLNVTGFEATTAANHPEISLDDIASWEAQHGAIPQGAVVAVRRMDTDRGLPSAPPPISADAAQFLMEARYTTGFVFETPVEFTVDRTLARQIALHGNYVVEGAARFTALPATGSLIIVAPAKNIPAKNKGTGHTPVRVLAMVR